MESDSRYKRKSFFTEELQPKNVYETQAIQRTREQMRENAYQLGSSSEQEHKVNALAQGAEEGRDKLRKAAGSCK